MEEEGQHIIKLNIGNIAAFGLEPPDEIVQDMIRNLPNAAGYTDSKGLFAPRKAIVHYTQQKHVKGVTVDDVFLGNGASELITMSMNALLNDGDEVLIPAPDYPLWTASVALSGGTPVHYLCDEANDWLPDLDDMAAKITPRTRAVVVINPNNPTGALYPDELLVEIVALARKHGLIVFADEIYDKTLYDGHTHTSIASLADDVLFLTFNGLSKNYRSCGYRAGWMVVSGEKRHAADYIEGLGMLASMRLCSNTPGQLAIQTALGGYQSIDDLVAPGGRLARQRDLAHSLLTAIPGVTCVKPKAALYMFPKLDPKIYPIDDDQQFAYELLAEQKVLIVQGTGFNWPQPRSPARRLPAQLRRPGRGDGPDRDLPRALPGAARGEVGQPAFLRMKPFQVGLLGAGVVGGGTFAVLQRNQEEIRRRAGREIRIAHVVDVDLARARRVAGDAAEVSNDARALIARPEIDA
jgi:alanine-synthesizing transaminase